VQIGELGCRPPSWSSAIGARRSGELRGSGLTSKHRLVVCDDVEEAADELRLLGKQATE
jgi:hypothetical protein